MEAILAESVSWARMKATLMGLASIFLTALAGRMARRRRVSISRGCFIFLSFHPKTNLLTRWEGKGGWATLGRCT